MAGGRSRRHSGDYGLFWPGYVDVLSTLLLVVTFMMSIFMLAQYFASQEASGKDTALKRLTLHFAAEHGPSACGLAFRVRDSHKAYARALARLELHAAVDHAHDGRIPRHIGIEPLRVDHLRHEAAVGHGRRVAVAVPSGLRRAGKLRLDLRGERHDLRVLVARGDRRAQHELIRRHDASVGYRVNSHV